MFQQHCSICGNEFRIATTQTEVGRHSSSDTCKTCLNKEKNRLAEFSSFPALMQDGTGFKNAEPTISEKGYSLPIQIWKFDQAPSIYKEMSNSGGDEDWIALIPPALFEYGLPFWLESMDSMHRPQVYAIAMGYKVVIASH